MTLGRVVGSRLRVSVVTPCLNMGGYIRRTIESTLANLEAGDEYFVIDGGSTDESVEIIKSYAVELTGWASERDGGYADALAKGFARATGDILYWINASDLLLAGALNNARERLAKSNADLIFGDDFYIDEHDRIISLSRGYAADLRTSMLYGGWTPLQDACFWRRDLYNAVGGIDTTLRYAADYDLFLRMSRLGRSVYVPLAFSAFRRHADQKSIAGVKQYRLERQAARARELAREARPRVLKLAASAWHAVIIRWRIHVAQRGWTRGDLHGRDISTVPSGQYWPLVQERTT